MRNLEALIGTKQKTSVVNQPDIPPVSPKDVFIKRKSTDEAKFPEYQHMTRFELKSMVKAGHMGIDEDHSAIQSPLVAEEPSVFAEPTSPIIDIFKAPIERARTLFQPSTQLEKAA